MTTTAHRAKVAPQSSIDRIMNCLKEAQKIRGLNDLTRSPEFTKWRRDTEVAIERIFGTETRHIRDFKEIHYSPAATTSSASDTYYLECYQRGIDRACAILQSFTDELTEYGVQSGSDPVSAVSKIRAVCSAFHRVVRRLRDRRQGRPALEVNDEYDVQDLMNALLAVFFDDIRREEWTPSYAGGASRMDFLLKQPQIVVEVKRAREGLSEREIGEQLIVDIEKYQTHPKCRTLVCFVYDPEGRIGNPVGLQNDLSGKRSSLDVEIIVMPV